MPRKPKIKLSGKAYKALCQKVYERDNGKCRSCNSREMLQAHHLVFRSRGGSHSMSNLALICQYCHTDIHGHNILVQNEQGTTELDGNKVLVFIRINGNGKC